MCFCSISCAAFLALSPSLLLLLGQYSFTHGSPGFVQTDTLGWAVAGVEGIAAPVIIYYFKAPILQYHYHGVLVGSCTTDLYSQQITCSVLTFWYFFHSFCSAFFFVLYLSPGGDHIHSCCNWNSLFLPAVFVH